MSIFTISLKKLFYSIDGFKNIFMFSLVLVIPWSLFSEILKYNQLVFYDSYNLRVFFFNSAFAIVVIIYLRSIVLSTIGFYTFIFLPFVTYYFLRKGVLYGDLQDIDELMYALGDLSSYVIYFSIFIFFLSAIFTNIRFFKVKIFLLQITFAIFIYFSYNHSQFFEKIIYPTKPNIEDFNVSAAFRNIGPVDAFLYHYLNTLSFEQKLMTNKEIMKYVDFRSYNLNKNITNRNIHIILMESFIDPTDFDNVKILKDIIPKQWFEFKSVNKLYGISPVSGGGSAQAEFEILCGAPSILEYGTEFNRMGEGDTSCLPNYLKKYGYKTIASQPMYGSFFNIEKAYKSIGFEDSYLTPNFDMSDMKNGWLSDESFFRQHFEFIRETLLNERPILNYVFAVGCHSVLGQASLYEPVVKYSKSKNLEETLNCNTKSIQYLNRYISKIKDLDPNSLIIILSDHYPPGVSDYVSAGHNCTTNNKLPCSKVRKMRIIFIGDHIKMDIYNKNFAYYELPEIIINNITDNALCKSVECSIDKNNINLNGKIVDRENLIKVSDQSLSTYHKSLYQSLLKESWLNIDE